MWGGGQLMNRRVKLGVKSGDEPALCWGCFVGRFPAGPAAPAFGPGFGVHAVHAVVHRFSWSLMIRGTCPSRVALHVVGPNGSSPFQGPRGAEITQGCLMDCLIQHAVHADTWRLLKFRIKVCRLCAGITAAPAQPLPAVCWFEI